MHCGGMRATTTATFQKINRVYEMHKCTSTKTRIEAPNGEPTRKLLKVFIAGIIIYYIVICMN